MSRKTREKREVEAGGGPSGGANWFPIALAVGGLVLAFVAWTDAKKIKEDTGKRLAEMDQRLGQMQTQVANAAKARPPAHQGPDPNKVYAVKTTAAPAKGNPTAPIVIAEFSDYQ